MEKWHGPRDHFKSIPPLYCWRYRLGLVVLVVQCTFAPSFVDSFLGFSFSSKLPERCKNTLFISEVKCCRNVHSTVHSCVLEHPSHCCCRTFISNNVLSALRGDNSIPCLSAVLVLFTTFCACMYWLVHKNKVRFTSVVRVLIQFSTNCIYFAITAQK